MVQMRLVKVRDIGQVCDVRSCALTAASVPWAFGYGYGVGMGRVGFGEAGSVAAHLRKFAGFWHWFQLND